MFNMGKRITYNNYNACLIKAITQINFENLLNSDISPYIVTLYT